MYNNTTEIKSYNKYNEKSVNNQDSKLLNIILAAIRKTMDCLVEKYKKGLDKYLQCVRPAGMWRLCGRVGYSLQQPD